MSSGRLTNSNARNFTPLRYPGGKAKLAPFVKELLRVNKLSDGSYIEPYAGGAGLALELLLQEHVSHIYLNDICRPVWAFWDAVVNNSEKLSKLVRDTPLTMDIWDIQKKILKNALREDDLKVGFAMFYLNRTNRSGILNGGVIGGRDQSGPWKIDARYNRTELVRRISAIANVSDRISLSNEDARVFLRTGARKWGKKSLIYLDPPYYVKGRSLYLDCYEHHDHELIGQQMMSGSVKQKWIVSYDNVQEIRVIYEGCTNMQYSLNYSAHEARTGSEVMFFCDGLTIPALVHPMKPMDAAAA
jgi:DNA adenine methylase